MIDFILHKENCSKHEAIKKAGEILGGETRAIKPNIEENKRQSTTGFLERMFTYFKNAVYNGNISSMQVGIEKLGSAMLYNYQYDQLNRLVGMDAYRQTAPSNWAATQDYKEKISYDPNGNILSYDRNGAGSVLDKFSYIYGANNNRLMQLKNSVNGGVYTYDYDSVGNVVKDELQAVNGIAWNAYGKVLSIAGKNVNYQYDATGNRVYKYAAGVTEYYVRDAQGNVMATYSNRAGAFAKSEQHLYGSSSLGLIDKPKALDLVNGVYLFKLGTGYKYELIRGKKQFELTNHLGNVLATISDKKIGVSSDNKTIDYYLPDLVTATFYSSYGASVNGYNFEKQVNAFNGQRRSPEISSTAQTAQYWEYDSRIGRRWNVEPLIHKYPSNSSNLVFNNNPILFADTDGKDWIVSTTKNKDGSITVHMKLTAAVINSSSNTNINMPAFSSALSSQVKNSYSISYSNSATVYETKIIGGGLDGINGKAVPVISTADMKINVVVDVDIRIIDNKDQLKKDEHLIEILDRSDKRVAGEYGHADKIGGKKVFINEKYVNNIINGNDNNTLPHELGHTAGLEHPDKTENKDQKMTVNESNKLNVMWSNQVGTGGVAIDDKKNTQISGNQINKINKEYKNGNLNKP